MKKVIMFLSLMLISNAAFADRVLADYVLIDGVITFADCSGLLVKPARHKDAGKCVVSYSGVSREYIAADGTRSTNHFEGSIAFMDRGLKPVDMVGKRVGLTLDLKKVEIVAWGQVIVTY